MTPTRPPLLLGLLAGLLVGCSPTSHVSEAPDSPAPAALPRSLTRLDSNPAPVPRATRAPRKRPAPVPRAAPRPRPRVVPLAEACRRRAAWLRARIPRRFHLHVEPPYVVAGDLARADFQQQIRLGLRRPTRAMYASLFDRAPDRPITVLLMASQRSYRRWAYRLFGDEDVAYFGYYKPGIRTMIMHASSGIGTLWHELTHALASFDFPRIPDWFNEGLGSLHEGAYVTRRRMVGVTNWRLPGLKDAIFHRRLRRLRSLITSDDFYSKDAGTNYAQARFFVQYLQHRGVLFRFYKAFRAQGPGRDLGASLVEKTLGKSLEQVEADFLRWVGRLRYRR